MKDFSENELNILKDIVELYRTVKELILVAEEADPEKKTKLGIFDELRHSLDHILRAISNILIPNLNNDIPDYTIAHFKNAYDHLFRAGIDVLDWLNIIYYYNIINILKDYKSEIINEAIPEYYPKLRIEIEETKKEISILRNHKDIGNKSIKVFNLYFQKIQRMKEIYDKIIKSEVSLIELKKRKEIWKDKRFIIGTSIGIIGIIIALVSVTFNFF